MKKILLGTTALFGAALVAQAALADAPKVTVGGFSEFQAGIMSDDQDTDQRNHAFRSDNEVSFKVDGKSDAGLGYGAEIWLEADVDGDDSSGSDSDHQGVNASKTFVYVEGTFGRFEGGSNLGPDQTLKVDAASIARGTGGIDGDWYYFANNTGATTNNYFVAKPDLPLNYGFSSHNNSGLGDESQENLNKITYYTPRWSGFQAGISYIPSDQERGQLTTFATRADHSASFVVGDTGAGADTDVSEADNIWVGGINYAGQWDQIGITLGATAERGNAEASGFEDLWAWQGGAKVSYMGFSIAGSYADWNDSLRDKTHNADDTYVWTVGGAYEYGPYGLSVTYLKSHFDMNDGTGTIGENKFRNWTIGADYKLAPGLTPYAEVSFYDQDAIGTGNDNDNDGHVFLLGTSLNF